MKIARKCNHCRANIFPRLADVRRGWGLYCSKSCKALAANPNKRSDANKRNTKLENLTSNMTCQSDLEFNINSKHIGYTRQDLLKLLDRKMVYEWDNKIFEDALLMHNLQNAYDYVVANGC